MPPSKAAELDYRPSYGAATIVGAVVLLLYLVTLAPSTSMWDTSEYIAAACVFGLPHPPGNPFFVIIGHLFCLVPLPFAPAVRINLLAALASAGSAAMWFLITERVLVSWLSERWQRLVGGVLGALIGATAFTVWNQSVVNEKVYTVSLFGLALISWLTVRWCDDPDGPMADRTLVLIFYLCGLGYANHMMGFLALPAVGVAILLVRPETLLRWKLLLACAGAVLLGLSPFLTQPIRAAQFPAINEGEPTTLKAFLDNFNRVQYGKPSLFERQAPFGAQVGMYWLYFKWQWLRDTAGAYPTLQNVMAAIYLVLGVFGGYVHWKRDRRSFWYFGTFMVTLTLLLIVYLNFKYGYSQSPELNESANGIQREVRDRDYFFLVSFSAWGVWAALGLVFVWESVAAVFGAEQVRIGRETVELPKRQSWYFAAPVLAFALIPLFVNWRAASRAGQTDTRDFAYDLLNSVEPYGVLVTVGDNDTFPLWYAQEVEHIRQDVTVANTSLLNTDWYTRQLIRRPIATYDSLKGPAIYRGKNWEKPKGPPLNMTLAEADSLPLYLEVRTPQQFNKGDIHATIPPQVLNRADIIVLNMIRDAFPARPMYFSTTAGSYAQQQLGLAPYLLRQGLARKLLPNEPKESADTVRVPGDGFVDLQRTRVLWDSVFLGYKAVIRRGSWVDRASVGIPYLYISTAASLSEAEQMRGDTSAASKALSVAEQVARATSLDELLNLRAAPRPAARPADQGAVPLLDTGAPAKGNEKAPAKAGKKSPPKAAKP